MSGKFSGTATLPIPNSSTRRTAVVQQLESRTLLSAGAFDTSFGTGGNVDPGMNAYLAVAHLPNGKAIAVLNPNHIGGYPRNTELARFNPDGKLDRSFGKAGFAAVTLSPTLRAPAIVVQSDGRILLSDGFDGSGRVFRFLQNGAPDRAFGDSGVVELAATAPFLDIEGLAVQADGKVVVGGLSGNSNGFIVARLTRSGKLDPTFGAGGQVVTEFGSPSFPTGSGVLPASLLVQKDGRITMAGYANGSLTLAIARYNPDGKLDPTFGTSGLEILNDLPTPFTDRFDMSQQADGKLLVPLRGGVGRLTSSGAPDPSFGVGGVASMPVAPMSVTQLQSVAVQKDGKIVGFGSSAVPLVARWDTSGTLDPTFGTSGVVLAQTPYFPTGAAVNVGGFVQKTGDIIALSTSGLMAYTPGGQLDPKFGHRGVEWNTNGLTGQIDASALQKNGKIIVAGSELAVSPSAPTEAALARYNADGSLDRTFGDDGRVYVTLGDNANFDSLVIQSDGKIVAGGYGQVGATREFLVARLTPSGRLDHSFHHSGVLTSAFQGAASQSVAALAMGPGRTIVAAGSADQQIAVERILRTGNLDSSFATGGQFAVQPMGQASSGAGVVVGNDGRITVGGTIGNNFGMIQLLPNGTFDAAFGTNGIVTTAFTDKFGAPTPSEANAMTTDAEGDLILGGSTGGFGPDPLLPLGTFALARYRRDGTLDPAFGSGGTLATPYGPGGTVIDGSLGEFFLVDSLAVQKDGKILAGGLVEGSVFVARLTDTGFDSTFGNLGINPNNPSSPPNGFANLGGPGFPGKPDDAPVTSVLVQPDGNIIAAHGTDLTRLTAT
ncbi:MAG: hypothetical protein JWN24_4266 [Phycisphaerales bacterium]|nr:hypothetical protein [Phycisphaerales bacterium]